MNSTAYDDVDEETLTAQDVVPTVWQRCTYNETTRELRTDRVWERLVNENLNALTPDSKFENYYTYLIHPDQDGLWTTYSRDLSFDPMGRIEFGTDKDYKDSRRGIYYLLRPKQSTTIDEFFIVGEEESDEFSLWRWLNPLDHLFTGVYTETYTQWIYLRAQRFQGRYKVERTKNLDDSQYLSLKSTTHPRT